MSNISPTPRSRAASWNNRNHSSRIPETPHHLPQRSYSEAFPLDRRSRMNQTTPARSSPLSGRFDPGDIPNNTPDGGQEQDIAMVEPEGTIFNSSPFTSPNVVSRSLRHAGQESPIRRNAIQRSHSAAVVEARRQLLGNYYNTTGQEPPSYQPHPSAPATLVPTTPQPLNNNAAFNFGANSAPAALENNQTTFSLMDSFAGSPEDQTSDDLTSRSTGVAPMVLPSSPTQVPTGVPSTPSSKIGPQLLPSPLPDIGGGFSSTPPPAVFPTIPSSPINNNQSSQRSTSSPPRSNAQPIFQSAFQPSFQPNFQHAALPTTAPSPTLTPSQHLALQSLQSTLSRHRAREQEIHTAFQTAQVKNLRPPTVYICNLCELRFLYTPYSIEPDDQGRAYCEECVGGASHGVMEQQKRVVVMEEEEEARRWREHGVDIGDHGVRMLIGGYLDAGAGGVEGNEVPGQDKGKGKTVDESDVGDGMVFGDQTFADGVGVIAGWQGQFVGGGEAVAYGQYPSPLDPALPGQYASTAVGSVLQGQYGGSGNIGGQDIAGTAGPGADPWDGEEDDYEQKGFDYDAYFAEDDASME